MKLKKNNKEKNMYKKSSYKVKMNILSRLKFNMYKRKLLIEMIMQDGDKDFFIAKISRNNTFKHLNKKYIVDEKVVEYYKPFRMYGCLYHEYISLPLSSKINTNKIINSVMTNSAVYDYANNIHPEVLQSFSDSKVIIDSIQGHAITGVFGFIKMMTIINLIVSGIVLLVLIGQSGVI